MGLLEKTKRRREKATRASIPVGLANAAWRQQLQDWSRIPAASHSNATTKPVVNDLPGWEPLHAFVDTVDAPWDQQSRWLKQLEKSLSAQAHQVVPTHASSTIQTCYQYLALAVVPIICQAFLLATDTVPRKLCIAVLQAADKMVVALCERAAVHGSPLKLTTAAKPLPTNALLHTLVQQILSTEYEQFLCAMRRSVPLAMPAKQTCLSEAHRPPYTSSAENLADVVAMVTEFDLGRGAITANLVPTVTALGCAAHDLTSSLTNLDGSLMITAHRANCVDQLKRITRTLQTVLTVSPDQTAAILRNPAPDVLGAMFSTTAKPLHHSLFTALLPSALATATTETSLADALWYMGSWLCYQYTVVSLDVALAAGMTMAYVLRTILTGSSPKKVESITVHIGRLLQVIDAKASSELPSFCMVRGLLIYLEDSVLFGRHSTSEQTIFAQIFNYLRNLCDACTEFQDKAMALETFGVWIQRYRAYLDQSPVNPTIGSPTTDQSDWVEVLLQYVWNFWDSPMVALQHKVRALFEAVVAMGETWNAVTYPVPDSLTPTPASLLTQLLGRIGAMAWTHKAKYSLLSVLIPRVGTAAIFAMDPQALDHSLAFIHDTMLRPRVTELHLALLKTGAKEFKDHLAPASAEALAAWYARWSPAYYRGLTAANDAIRRNVGSMVLPALLQTFPGILPHLLRYSHEPGSLADAATSASLHQPHQLHARITLARTARLYHANPLELADQSYQSHALLLPESDLKAALHHPDDTLRSELLGLLCEARKSTQDITALELQWIQAFLRVNMGCPDPDFRHRLLGVVNRLFVRLRGLCYLWERTRSQKLRWVTKVVTQHDAMLLSGALLDANGLEALMHSLHLDPAYPTDDNDNQTRQARPLAGALFAVHAVVTEQSAKIDRVSTFLRWVLDTCMQGLYPGAPYPRTTTSLKLLELLIVVFGIATTPPPDGFVPKVISTRTHHLVSTPKAKERAPSQMEETPPFPFRLPIATSGNTQLLVHTLTDDYDENRLLAFTLLRAYFPTPLPSYESDEVIQQLLHQAWAYIKTGRAYKTESGALILRLVLSKCVLNAASVSPERIARWFAPTDLHDGQALAADQVPGSVLSAWSLDSDAPPTVHFLGQVLNRVDYACQVADKDLLCAANHHPIQGALLAVRCLLEEIAFDQPTLASSTTLPHWMLAIEAWRPLIARILTSVQRVSGIVMDVLSNPSPEGNIPASFQELGETIDALATESFNGQDESLGGVESSASPKHQVTLSYCWRAIKEASALLSTVLCSVPAEDAAVSFDIPANAPGSLLPDRPWLLDTKALLFHSQQLRDWLLAIRHSGAFSAVHPEFAAVCARLLTSLCHVVVHTPHQWLDDALHAVVTRSVSITRRSAGLPLCVLAIVSSEAQTNRPLLADAVNRLFTLALQPIESGTQGSSQHGVKGTGDNAVASVYSTDLPQVHAFNILRKLFSDAVVSIDMLAYIDRGVELAIRGFSSDQWAIRNCAVMLFSTLVNKTFGMKSARTIGDAETASAWDPPSLPLDGSVTVDELMVPACSPFLKSTDALSTTQTMNTPCTTAVSQTLTAREFFHRFPRLYSFLLQELRDAVVASQLLPCDEPPTTPVAAAATIHPSVYPILLLLSRLQAPLAREPVHANVYQLDTFIPLIEACGRSTIWKARVMAAQALSALMGAASLLPYAHQRCQALLVTMADSAMDFNTLHGTLCQLLALLQSPAMDAVLAHPPWALEFVGNFPAILHLLLTQMLSTNRYPGLVQEMAFRVQRQYLRCLQMAIVTANAAPSRYADECGLIRTLVLPPLRQLHALLWQLVRAELMNDAITRTSQRFTPRCRPANCAGEYFRPQELAQIGLRLAFSDEQREFALPNPYGSLDANALVAACLQHPAYEVQFIALKFLNDTLVPTAALYAQMRARLDFLALAAQLMALIHQGEGHTAVIALAAHLLQCLAQTHCDPTSLFITKALPFTLGDFWASIRRRTAPGQQPSLLVVHLLPMAGAILPSAWSYTALSVELEVVRSFSADWSTWVLDYSHVEQPLPYRSAAADALCPVIDRLFQTMSPAGCKEDWWSLSTPVEGRANLARLVLALTRLLQDDDQDIRALMAQSVSQAYAREHVALPEEKVDSAKRTVRMGGWAFTPHRALYLTWHRFWQAMEWSESMQAVGWYLMSPKLDADAMVAREWVNSPDDESMAIVQRALWHWPKKLQAALQAATGQSHLLFDAEKRNLYQEDLFQVQLAYQCFTKQCRKARVHSQPSVDRLCNTIATMAYSALTQLADGIGRFSHSATPHHHQSLSHAARQGSLVASIVFYAGFYNSDIIDAKGICPALVTMAALTMCFVSIIVRPAQHGHCVK
ncbi:hypothetical protein H4R34_001523 [Dimargaris verticillata]|uniref:DUF2428 domain-containing protein n=1 Tax=Dimargaris verticillata TaxID=2761393 RepID=A0A9W8BB76_9FUNG|nr:hypothetical protein H4R34_001523 [Dimargaris verticillata]